MSLNNIRTSNNGYALPRKFTGRIGADYVGSNIVTFTGIRGQDGSISMTIHQALIVNLVNNELFLNLLILGDNVGQEVDEDFRTILENEQSVPINIGGSVVNEIGCLVIAPRSAPSTVPTFSVKRNNSVAFGNGTYQIFTPGATVKWINSLY